MSYLINDNIPEWFALNGKNVKTRKATDDAEFFALLKKKILEDIERVFAHKDIEDKTRAICDLYIDIEPLRNRIESKLSKSFAELINDRKGRVGVFEQRLVVDETEKPTDEKTSIVLTNNSQKLVMEYGVKNNYPDMILKKDTEGRVYKTLGQGKKAWDAAMGWAELEFPGNENFLDLVVAVKNNDRHDSS